MEKDKYWIVESKSHQGVPMYYRGFLQLDANEATFEHIEHKTKAYRFDKEDNAKAVSILINGKVHFYE